MGVGFSYVEDTETTSYCSDSPCISKYVLRLLSKLFKHHFQKYGNNSIYLVGSGESSSVISILAQSIL